MVRRQCRTAPLTLRLPSLLGNSKKICTSNQTAWQGLWEVTSCLSSTWWPSIWKRALKPHMAHLSGQAEPPWCMPSATCYKHTQATEYIIQGEYINIQCIYLIFLEHFFKIQGYQTISFFCYGNNIVFLLLFFKLNEICCRALLLIIRLFSIKRRSVNVEFSANSFVSTYICVIRYAQSYGLRRLYTIN